MAKESASLYSDALVSLETHDSDNVAECTETTKGQFYNISDLLSKHEIISLSFHDVE